MDGVCFVCFVLCGWVFHMQRGKCLMDSSPAKHACVRECVCMCVLVFTLSNVSHMWVQVLAHAHFLSSPLLPTPAHLSGFLVSHFLCTFVFVQYFQSAGNPGG